MKNEHARLAARRLGSLIRTSALCACALIVFGSARAGEPSSKPGRSHDLARELGALEERSYAAWQAGDATFWDAILADEFVGWGPAGRLDKRTAAAALRGTDCRILHYRLQDEQATELTPTVELLTHRTEVDGTCHGKPVAPASYTATIYVRRAGHWRIAYRAQSAIVDPVKAVKPAGGDLWNGGAARNDVATRTLLAREQAVVTAWKDHDAARMAALFGPQLQFVDIFGDHIANRAAALKAWSGEGCEVKSFELSGAKATMLAPDIGVLTYLGVFDGTCFGQALWPIWATAFYVKHGDAWLWSSGINVLAGAP